MLSTLRVSTLSRLGYGVEGRMQDVAVWFWVFGMIFAAVDWLSTVASGGYRSWSIVERNAIARKMGPLWGLLFGFLSISALAFLIDALSTFASGMADFLLVDIFAIGFLGWGLIIAHNIYIDMKGG